jgi:hypothetical protein
MTRDMDVLLLYLVGVEYRATGRGDEDVSQNDRLKQLQALAVDFAKLWKSAAEWLPDGQPCFYLGLAVWDPSLEGHR